MERSESDEGKRVKLASFIEKIRAKNVKEWSNADHLAAVASRAMVQLIKQKPAVGWVRADKVSTQEAEGEIKDLKLQVATRDAKISELEEFISMDKPSQTNDDMLEKLAPITYKVFRNAGLSHEEFLEFLDVAFHGITRNTEYFAAWKLADHISTNWHPNTSIDNDFIRDAILFLSKDRIFEIDTDEEIFPKSELVRDAIYRFRLCKRLIPK